MYDPCVPLGTHCRSTNIGRGSERISNARKSCAPDPGTYRVPSAFDKPNGRYISPNILPRSSYARLQDRLSRSASPVGSRSRESSPPPAAQEEEAFVTEEDAERGLLQEGDR